jgi:hypothetical protein
LCWIRHGQGRRLRTGTLKAWQQFNRAVGKDGSVGIWHETYSVAAGRYETIYGNMPKFDLAAAIRHVPVGKRGETAREHLTT